MEASKQNIGSLDRITKDAFPGTVGCPIRIGRALDQRMPATVWRSQVTT